MSDEELQRLLVLDGAPGPAIPIDTARANAIVDAALDGAGYGPGSAGGTSGAARGGATAAKAKLAIFAGAAVVAVAIALLGSRATRDGSQQAALPPADAAIDAGGGAEQPAPDTNQSVAAPAPSTEPDDAPRTAQDDAPSEERPARRRVDRADDASDLLAAANAKRAARQWRESDALYARVVQRAPKSLAAQTALVASASLHLEHLGDPKGAAQRFRRALAIAPRGALAEDARWGLAEAARALRDTAAEKAALDDFLAHHPASPLAPRAKARRAELP